MFRSMVVLSVLMSVASPLCALGGSLSAGRGRPGAALEPYRKACESLAEKK